MKKILYSAYTKATAVFLILLISFFGFYQFAENTLPKLHSIDNYESAVDKEIGQKFQHTFNLIFKEFGLSTYCYLNGEDAGIPLVAVKQLEFYAVCGEKTFSNMSAETQETTKNMLTAPYGDGLYHLLENGGIILENSSEHGLNIEHNYSKGFYFSSYDNKIPFTIIIVPTDSYRTEYLQRKAESDNAISVLEGEIETELILLIWLAVMILALSVYLSWVCGKKIADTEIHLLLIDRFWEEILWGIVVISVFLLCMAMTYFAHESIYYSSASSLYPNLFALSGTAAIGTALTAWLSTTRKIKNHSFTKRSLIVSAIVWIVKNIKHIYSHIKTALSIKTGVLVGVAIIIYGFLMYAFSMNGAFCFIFTVIMLVLALKAVVGFDELRKGISELCAGNTNYKIKNSEESIIGDLCRQVDSIGDGISIAVDNQLSAERMKSQLITNVSHDLKTPLTAIINYAELLCETELSPAEANEYAQTILAKSAKLKALTSDLFDISKVQSGNEVIAEEDIDVSLLINQSLAELDEEIKKSGFEINSSLAENCMIKGDGAKLSRVIENLLLNALKYSLNGTRIYLLTACINGSVNVEIKNISAYPLDFDTSDITERFVRGDASRSTEGNGLGLAIAKSYTEAMGGILQVITDGDLFKVVLSF